MDIEINEILSDMILEVMTPGVSRAAVKKAASKLQTRGVEENFELSDGYAAAKAALEVCGRVIAGTSEGSAGMVCGVIYSGFGNMNPCYIIISANNGQISVKAYAKEGLIRQHTAERALESFKKVLFN